jgi:hypothetical protein
MRPSLRAGALLAAGSLAVHELRFLAGYGAGGDGQAAAGHGYLAWVAPLVALALAAACGAWLARVGRSSSPARPAVTWLGASSALAATYVVQETIEGLTSPGHPGLIAHGGWIALPFALAVGALVALMLRGAHAADEAAATVARPWSPFTITAAPPAEIAVRTHAPARPRLGVLARRLAGRGPPLAS